MDRNRFRYWLLAAVFKARGLLMIPPLAYAFVHFDSRFEKSVSYWLLGIALFALGLVLRIESQRYLRYRLHTRARLATDGPYRVVRNPVYWGNMSIFAGLALMAEVPWMTPLIVLWAFCVYDLAVRFEEWRLLKRFGVEYSEYQNKTPRWIPRLKESIRIVPSRKSHWARAILVESHCILLLAFPIAKEILELRLGGWNL